MNYAKFFFFGPCYPPLPMFSLDFPGHQWVDCYAKFFKTWFCWFIMYVWHPCMCVYTMSPMGNRHGHWGVLYYSPSRLNLELRLAANKRQPSSCLHVLNTGVTGIHSHTWLFTWVLELRTRVLVLVRQDGHSPQANDKICNGFPKSPQARPSPFW